MKQKFIGTTTFSRQGGQRCSRLEFSTSQLSPNQITIFFNKNEFSPSRNRLYHSYYDHAPIDLFSNDCPSFPRSWLPHCSISCLSFHPRCPYPVLVQYHPPSRTLLLISNPSLFQPCHLGPQFNWKPCLHLSFPEMFSLSGFPFRSSPPADV